MSPAGPILSAFRQEEMRDGDQQGAVSEGVVDGGVYGAPRDRREMSRDADGHPLFVCLKKPEFTKKAIVTWAKTSLAASARVVSDGLWCFTAVTDAGAIHERTVTGGGAASAKMEQFTAINTFLGNLKTAYSGTYHAFHFSKYAHR